MSSILRDKKLVSEAISQATSQTHVLELLGLRAAGGNFSALKKACTEHGLTLPTYRRAESQFGKNVIPLSQILVKGSNYQNQRLKRRLVSEKLLADVCSSCGTGPFWNNQILVLQLEHINGISNDNRIENLTVLCPNCHSQTSTFCGRNKPHLCGCGSKIKTKAKQCHPCAMKVVNGQRVRSTKIEWPPDDVLLEMVRRSSFVQVGRELGVSDNAIRKHLKI